MTIEKRVEYLEDKLARTIEVLQFLIQVDNGLNKDITEILLDRVEELQQQED